MRKFKEEYNKLSRHQKIIFVSTLFLSCIVLAMSVIGLFGIIDINIINSISIPILGVVIFLNGILTYKNNKALGIFVFSSAIFIFCICIVVFYTRLCT